MSLLAEVVVEEWLNRNGYFTIRGIRVGNGEVDLLAIRPLPDGTIERRHVEVQASSNPIGYLATGNARRLTDEELDRATEAWVEKKFGNSKKQELFKNLAGSPWSRELVCHKLCYEDKEREALERYGIKLTDLRNVVSELRTQNSRIKKASGSDLIDLMGLLD